ATDSSTLTITVVGSNDAPVANADTASADENQTLMVDVLVNDTDVDASDTHTLQSVTLAAGPGGTDLQVNQETKSAALGVNQGAVAIVDNQIEWNPGADFDHLALNETATVVIDYTMSDNNGATDSSTLTLTVTGLNDAPTVLAPLSQTASEEDSPFTLDLLSGAVDVDRGAVLNVSNLTIADGQGGWVLEGNTLRVDPHHFDDLSTGDLETLTFNYNVVDQHGAAVAQTLTLNIEGFTDAPSLAAEASAAPAVNEIRLRIASEPANSERVVLTFANLPSGAVVRNAAGVAVTGGVDNFVGTHEFLVTLPPNVDTNIDLGIIVTGYKPDGTPIASKTGYIDLVYEHTSVSDAVTFSSNNQGIWASGPAPMVQWHEYIPLVGGVTKVWVAEEDGEGHWEDTGTGTWTSGEFSLFSASVSAEDAIDIALTVPRSVLDAAKTVYNTLVKAGQDAFDYAWGVYLDASSTANNIFNGAVQTAWNVFNSVVGTTVAVATKAAYDIYNGAVKVAADIRDAALVADFLDWFTGAIWDTYHFAESVARKALNLALDAVEGIAEGARVVLNEAIEAARVIKDGAIDLAGKALNLARDAFNLVKEGASATLGLAQQAYDAIANELNKVQGETSVDINAELFAEVGVQIDFVLDSGSVDTEVHYDLASTLQHNRTTDMLAITPMLINRTTGDAVAFATISPNASLKAVLLYDVGADLRVLLDSNLVVAGTTLWDITPGGTPINIGTTVTTGGWGPDFENFKSGIMDLAGDINFNGVAVGELVLVDFDTTALDQYEVPFIGTLTEDIVTLEVGFPTIQTEGKAATYTSGYFNEGGLIAVDITEVTQSILNLVNAKIDLSPELRDELNLGSLQDAASFADLVALVGEAFLGTIFAALDGQSESMPIFLLDANDATDTSLIHANLIPDWVIGNTVTADTAKYGFFTTYGESNELVRVTIDIDQAVAVIVNKIVEAAAAAGTSGATVQFLQALPDVNPLDLEFGLAEILKAVEAPQSMIDQITKFFDLSIGFEAADLDVYSALKFSQEFTLSLDDVEYEVTMEDDAVYRFAANADGNLVIENASQHDANGDGVVDYDINLVPKAMFSNDTEIGLTIGYVIDFLQASLAADLKLPLGELLNISIPGNPDIKLNLADVNLGPLLRIQGDLDLASADIFESRFNIDIGSDTVSGNYALPEEELVTLVGVMPA
ncbi:MAG: Ig-like domain-containing protein, partial [Pseudohongiellaceae bacterium]